MPSYTRITATSVLDEMLAQRTCPGFKSSSPTLNCYPLATNQLLTLLIAFKLYKVIFFNSFISNQNYSDSIS
jgi:hypothetical protein